MRKANDMSRCLAAFNQDSTLVVVIELGLKSWLVAGIVPGIERHPLKKLKPNEGSAASPVLSLVRGGKESGPSD
jgi:transposase